MTTLSERDADACRSRARSCSIGRRGPAAPGGQHVNTSSTRIELLWDLRRLGAVTDEQRERLRTKLAARLDSRGMVRVVASDRRSQGQNGRRRTSGWRRWCGTRCTFRRSAADQADARGEGEAAHREEAALGRDEADSADVDCIRLGRPPSTVRCRLALPAAAFELRAARRAPCWPRLRRVRDSARSADAARPARLPGSSSGPVVQVDQPIRRVDVLARRHVRMSLHLAKQLGGARGFFFSRA